MGLRRQREMTTLQAGRDAVACSWTPLPARATRGLCTREGAAPKPRL